MDIQEINILLNNVENNREHLNTLQKEFITSLKENYNATGVLTKRQVEFLYDSEEVPIRSRINLLIGAANRYFFPPQLSKHCHSERSEESPAD